MLLLVVSAKWLLQGSAVPGPQTVALFDFIQNGHTQQNPEGAGISSSNPFQAGWLSPGDAIVQSVIQFGKAGISSMERTGMGITGAPFSIKVVYFFNGFIPIFLFSYICIWLGFPLFSDLTATLGHFPFFTLLPYSVSLCRPFLYLILK